MPFQDDIAALNEFHFFREFTFSRTTFRPTPQNELELADNIVWLGDTLLIYQIKEREAANTTPENEQRWFEKKVIGLATGQIRDTLSYLEAYPEIEVENHRGHRFNLRFEAVRKTQKIVLYQPHASLPVSCRSLKHYRSRTAGIIHLFAAEDYRGLLRTLLTPAEVADYLEFREMLIEKWETPVARLPEQALAGQYFSGNFDCQPSINFVEHLVAVEHKVEEWDMSGIIDRFADRITSSKTPIDYYAIVREIALLKRNELREIKKRIQFLMERSKANKSTQPFRIAIPRTQCGFAFVPLTQDDLRHRQKMLQTLTFVLKYEQRLPKCVGVSYAFEGDGWYSEEWCYMEFPWEEDASMEEKLRTNNPFPEAKYAELQRYEFRKGEPCPPKP